ncbi:hypothetical protein JRO89_XS02G0277000 [Xanthoceras sorbifolium]|uniref:BED-type domain-containing protein n=1 Tax=Xanthoceras sorbifolium TaxID=99658 RepID=A0ABQ8IHE0_9ROSI|nr:hypothetical protein JRO89_XS02G0277000 [Xanthoceras sorbifolium]
MKVIEGDDGRRLRSLVLLKVAMASDASGIFSLSNPSNNDVVQTHPHHQTQDIAHIRVQNAKIESEMLNLDLGNSSYSQQRNLRSDQLWKHFEKDKGEDGTEWAICNYCLKKLVGSINSETKHLGNHFEKCRKKRNIGDRGGDHKPAEAGSLVSNPIFMEKESVIDKRMLDVEMEMVRMISKSGDRSSLDSIKADHIIHVYKQEKERVQKYLENLSCRLCLTIHRHRNNFWFLVHFIDDDWKLIEDMIISFRNIEEDSNILKCLKDVVLEWGIGKKISFIIKFCEAEKDHVDENVMSYNEITNWFTNRGSLPFVGKLLDIYSSEDMTDDYWHLCVNLNNVVFHKTNKIFYYVKETSSHQQNFQIAIERAKSLGKEMTAEFIPTKCKWNPGKQLVLKKHFWSWRI